MTKQKLKAAMAMMADRDNAARDVAVQLGMSVSTLYAYVYAEGTIPDMVSRGELRPLRDPGATGIDHA